MMHLSSHYNFFSSLHPTNQKMFSSVLVLAVVIISVSANPSPQTIVTPLVAVSPAVVTAHSYQVISRNFNALASPIRADALIKNAPSILSRRTALVTNSPIVAAETSPLVDARITSIPSNKSSTEGSPELSRASSTGDSTMSQAKATRTVSPTRAAAAPLTNAPEASSAKSSSVNPAGSTAVSAGILSGSAAYSALPTGTRAVSVGPIPAPRAAFTALPATLPYVSSSAYFPSAYTTSNYLTYPRLF